MALRLGISLMFVTCAFAASARMHVDHEGHVIEPSGSRFLARGVNWGKRSMKVTSQGEVLTIYNQSDPKIAKALLPGVNHVRLVLDYYDPSGACATDIFDAASPHTGFINVHWLKFIDNAVSWTEEAGLWITITLRNNYGTASPHGESTNDVPCDADYIGNATARALWFDTWQFLAKRYLNASNIAWYEPASEPHLDHGTKASGFAPCHSHSEIHSLFEEVLAVIRAVDDATPVSMTATGYSSCPGITAVDKMSDRNVIYNMNWPCHLGTANNVGYGSEVSCESMGKELPACLPECQAKGSTVTYNRSLVANLMRPSLEFVQKHKVPLWVDQLMCAPRSQANSHAWLKDSFAVLGESLSASQGFHFDMWTWKGGAAGDPLSMSVLVEGAGGKFGLQDYVVDEDVLALYQAAFASAS